MMDSKTTKDAEELAEKALLNAPVEPLDDPTEAMLIAARDWSYEKYGKPIGNDAATGCWKAMLAAAPSPSNRKKV